MRCFSSSRVPLIRSAAKLTRPPLSSVRRPFHPSSSSSSAYFTSQHHPSSAPSLSLINPPCSSFSSPLSSSSSSSSYSPLHRLSSKPSSLSPLPYTTVRHCSHRRMCGSRRADDVAAASTNASHGREVLPTNVKPVHYDLTLEPDFGSFRYNGTVAIEYVSIIR